MASWQARLVHPAWTAEPNAGHRALAELERTGHLDTLVTQNIDGLHQKAGSSPERVIEIHGTVRDVMCMACGERAPMERALDRVRAGEADPPCRSCGGILKSATISFGQSLVAEDLSRAEKAARGCDLFLALGTTLTVYPVAYLPQMALEAGARLVIANAEPTPFDGQADAVLRGNLGDVLPASSPWSDRCSRECAGGRQAVGRNADRPGSILGTAVADRRTSEGEGHVELPRTSASHQGPDPRGHTGTGRAGAGPGHLPRRPGGRRVRAGDDPGLGVHPPGQPRAVGRGQDPRQGHPGDRVLRRRRPLGLRRQDPGRARLHRRRLDGGRVQPVEERGPQLGHPPDALGRAAQPVPAAPAPARGRRRRPAEAARLQGAAARRRRARLPRRPLPGRRRCRHARHHRHGRGRRLQPAAPDPPQHGPGRRAQGRLGQEDAHRPEPRRERRHLRRPPRRRQRPRRSSTATT